jgi:outer membrane protein with beta-barrel domain
MKRNGLLLALVLLTVSAPAFAQGWEITPFVGWKTGGNLELTSQTVLGEIHANDGFMGGIAIGIDPRPDFTFEARYHYMDSGIFVRPATGADVDVANMVIHQIMGDFLFSKPGRTENTFPYFLIGLGANIFDPGSTNGALGAPVALRSQTKFTWSLGVGVKKFNQSGSGARLDIRYNPTYINSTQTGYWCDPFYGCYTTADAHYFDQWEFSLGFVKKLGYNR